MKSILVYQFGGPEVLKLEEVAQPSIQPDEVLIRVEKASVNYADIKKRTGTKGTGKLPFVPGIDAAGTIEKIGTSVSNLAVGQRVITFPSQGSYAEFVSTKASLTFVTPDEIDFTTAAACPIVTFLSYKLLRDIARMDEGDNILVHAAAGGVGTTIIQFAKLFGAKKIIGAVSDMKKAKVVYDAGATNVITYDDFPEKVNDLTGGYGADIVLDSISGKVSEKSLECLAHFGRLVHFGDAGGETGSIDMKSLHASCRSILGFSLGTMRKERPDLLSDTAEHVLPLLASGKIKMNIGKEFSLSEVQEAHRHIESRKSTGKIILNIRG